MSVGTLPPREELLSRLAEKLKRAGERLAPKYAVLESDAPLIPGQYPIDVKLYGKGTPVDDV